MKKRTTVWLSEERRVQLRKLALLDGTQAETIDRALEDYWAKHGAQAERVWDEVERYERKRDKPQVRREGDSDG